MFRNYILVAVRNLWKRKLFSLINVIGLSVGIACFFLIAANLMDEFSYDNFHENTENLYRVALERIYPDNVVNYAIIPSSLGGAMLNDFPEVEDMTRIFKIRANVIFRYDNKTYEEDKLFFVEPKFFEIFNIPLLEGDPAQVFSTPNSLVMTRDTALKYFGDEDAVGKSISTPQGEFLVSGVCENVPKNSHMELDFAASLAVLGFDRQPNYVSFSVYTYVVLSDGTRPKEIEAKLPALVEHYAAGPIQARSGISYKEYIAAGNGYNYFLQPIRDIHLHSNLTGEIKPNGNITYVYILIAIAIFLIVIACINFMNLATAISVTRAREVGIRKIVGSTRRSIIRQFLLESLVLSFVSLVIAGLMIQIVLPVFNNVARKELEINFISQPLNLVMLLVVGLVVGILAGSYPAFVLSSFHPVTVLKGRFSASRKGIRLRNILVIFQFAISIVLISMTLLISRQMDFMLNRDLGFDKDNLIVVERAYSLGPQGEAFKQELKGIPGVVDSAGTNATISGGLYFGIMFQTEQDSEIKTTRGMNVDKDFIKTLDLKILDGRGFAKEFNDSFNVIINEAAIREFGWDDPVGMRLKRIGDPGERIGDFTVIGVVKDFHYNSLHEDIDSFVLFTLPEGQPQQQQPPVYTLWNVRIRPENTEATLTAIENTWKKFAPGQPFSSYFMDDMLDDLYQNERISGQIFSIFSMLAIVIACIGLFGLSTYMAEQRTKEIGIRKVLGSTASKIVVLLSKDFAKLVAGAFLIAVPVAYFIMYKWLQDFSFRVNIQFWIFLVAGVAALIVAQFTISFQAIKAANSNPADAIRFE
jgi:putative ABC transport system permease protein